MPSPPTPNVHPASPVPAFAPGVRDAIYAHVYLDPSQELGGLLVGDRRPHGDIVVGAIRADGARGDVTSLTFTQEAWAHMLAELDARYPDAEVLGWYHSHPGHGIFLSRHDRFIHEHFFRAPWQIAIVVDPQRHQEGLFMWRPEGLVQIAAASVDPTWAEHAASPAGTPTRPDNRHEASPEEPPGNARPAEADPTAPPHEGGDDAIAASQRRADEQRAIARRKHARARLFAAFGWLVLAGGVLAWVLRLS